MAHDPNYYLPENHEYVTHRTYTGPGCVICGQPEQGHKPKRENVASSSTSL